MNGSIDRALILSALLGKRVDEGAEARKWAETTRRPNQYSGYTKTKKSRQLVRGRRK